jgi:rhodanese-related sulfurtransferase
VSAYEFSAPGLMAFFEANPLLSLALLGLTLALVYTEASRLLSGFKAVDPAGLTALVNRQDALLVDVSPATDYEKGHIAGAKNLPLAQFDPAAKLLAKAKESPVVVACRTGMSSSGAARKLAKAGFKQVFWLDGGTAAWTQASLPLVKGRQ